MSQTIFLNKLSWEVKYQLSGIPFALVIKAGAYNLRSLELSLDQLHTLRMAYQAATREVFIFLLVTAGLAFFTTLGFEHKNVKKVDEQQRAVTQDIT